MRLKDFLTINMALLLLGSIMYYVVSYKCDIVCNMLCFQVKECHIILNQCRTKCAYSKCVQYIIQIISCIFFSKRANARLTRNVSDFSLHTIHASILFFGYSANSAIQSNGLFLFLRDLHLF